MYMMGQSPKSGNELVPINNQNSQTLRPGSQVARVPRNYLVGDAANDERFNTIDAANDATFEKPIEGLTYTPKGDEVLDPINASTRRYNLNEADITDVVPKNEATKTTGEAPGIFVGDPVQVKETVGEYKGVLVGDPVQIRETTGDNPGIMIGEPREMKVEKDAQAVVEPVVVENDALLDVRPGFENPEKNLEREKANQEALSKLGKVRENRGGFLKGLREKMGLAQDKMEAVAGKVGKAMDAYNKWEPKTKLAVGLGFTALSMVGVASGATFLVGGIGLLRFIAKGASTKMMYDGLAGMLDKKYAELGEVSETRKKVAKLGALATAVLVNFAVSEAITNVINETGVFDKMKDFSLRSILPSAYAGELPGTMAGHDANGSLTGVNDGYGTTTATPATFGSDFGPGDRPEVRYNDDFGPGDKPGTSSFDTDREFWPEKPASPDSSGTAYYGSTQGAAPSSAGYGVSSGSVTGSPATQPMYGFDAASAPPVGSTELRDPSGKLLGWKLPDGTSMTPEGRILAPEGSTLVLDPTTGLPTNILRFPDGRIMDYVSGNITDAPTPGKPPVTYGAFGDEIPTSGKVQLAPVEPARINKDIVIDTGNTAPAQTVVQSMPNKFDVGVEESFAKQGNVAQPTIQQPSSGLISSDGSPIKTTDGSVVFTGEGKVIAPAVGQELRPSTPTNITIPETDLSETRRQLEEETRRRMMQAEQIATTTGLEATKIPVRDPSISVAATPSGIIPQPAISNPEVVLPKPDAIQTAAVSTPTITPGVTQLTFTPSTAPMSMEEMGRLTAFNTFTKSEIFDQALTSAAKDIDKASSFISFGEKGTNEIKNSFLGLLKNNPAITVEGLLTAKDSNLSTLEASRLKEAQGMLRRILAEQLNSSTVQKANVISVLQSTFKQ